MMMWETLVPVLVGGLLTLAGGFIGPLLLQERKDRAEKKKHRAEKFEELVAAVYEHNHWLELSRNVRVFGTVAELPVSPFAKVQAVSNVYFPELVDTLLELDRKSTLLEVWISNAAVKRIAKNDNFTEGYMDAYSPYSTKLNSVLGELREFAKKEFR
jgi:hypothetical protein